MENWKKIWNKNKRVEKIILETLIKADGFDSGAGSFSVDNWSEYLQLFFKKLDIKNGQSVFDVGCGSGAFIYPLFIQNHKVGGVDYSSVLINLANTIMKNSSFEIDEAINIDINEKYDLVISHSVFHYFKNLEYAKNTIEKMFNKSNSKIAILDINDKSKEDMYHKIRMTGMSKDKYIEKYKGLEHMFYETSWFKNIADELECKIDIFDQSYDRYANSALRFNVIMEKVT